MAREYFEIVFTDGRVEPIPSKYLAGVLYGITRLEQTPVLPLLGVDVIREVSGRPLWPSSAIVSRREHKQNSEDELTQAKQVQSSTTESQK
ncbi:hypothetical protein [Yoonia sp. SS1-5]|uniref:Uncharacterized protein n=1 Tax=Yoonia rhodophyticola TaxID=3137370 RepID=A0ABZ3JCL0_9RHOB